MKSTLEILSIFFISILFLFHANSENLSKINNEDVEIKTETKQILTKSIDYKAIPIIIVKRD